MKPLLKFFRSHVRIWGGVGFLISLTACHEVPPLELHIFDPESTADIVQINSAEFNANYVNGEDAIHIEFEISPEAMVYEDLIDYIVILKGEEDGWLLGRTARSLTDTEIVSGQEYCYKFGLIIEGETTHTPEGPCITVP